MKEYLEQLVKVNVLKFNQAHELYEINNRFQITLAENGNEWNISCFYIDGKTDKVMAVTDEWDNDDFDDIKKEFSNPDYLTIERVVEVTLQQLLDEVSKV